MAGGDGLLEELEHVLEDLDARVEQVDPLRDLEVASRGFVERLEVGVRLPGTRQYYAHIRYAYQRLGGLEGGRKRAAAWYRRRSELGRQGDDRATSSE